MKLYEHLGTGYRAEKNGPDDRWVLGDERGRIGIELELENVAGLARQLWEYEGGDRRPHQTRHEPTGHPLIRTWYPVRDGSLRNNAIELVSLPVWGQQLTTAMEELHTLLMESRYTISYRCGLHVHHNMTDLDLEQFITYLKIYGLCEPLLFNAVGTDRSTNPYCVPFVDTPRYLQNVWRMRAALDPNRPVEDAMPARYEIQMSIKAGAKYQALNLLPLLNLGTVEYRHAPAYQDMDNIKAWVGVVHSIKAAVYNPEITQGLEYHRPDHFYQMVFGDYMPWLARNNPDLFECMDIGMRVVKHIDIGGDQPRGAVKEFHPAFDALKKNRLAYFRKKKVKRQIKYNLPSDLMERERMRQDRVRAKMGNWPDPTRDEGRQAPLPPEGDQRVRGFVHQINIEGAE